MSDTSTPAGNPGGDTTTPIAAALAELPARIRVHALAKLLDRSSREVLAAVTELGADGRSVQSSIDRELALRVAEHLGVTTPGPNAEVGAAAQTTDPTSGRPDAPASASGAARATDQAAARPTGAQPASGASQAPDAAGRSGAAGRPAGGSPASGAAEDSAAGRSGAAGRPAGASAASGAAEESAAGRSGRPAVAQPSSGVTQGRGPSSAPPSAGARQPAGFRQAESPFRQTVPQGRQAPVAGSPGFTAPSPATPAESPSRVTPPTPVFASASPLFLPPEPPAAPPRPPRPEPEPEVAEDEVEETEEVFAEEVDEGRPRRRRGRRGRGRGKGGQDDAAEDTTEEQEKPDKAEKPEKPAKRAKVEAEAEETEEQEQAEGEDAASRRRRRRRRRRGGDADEPNGAPTEDDPPNTVVHVREAREDKEKPESDGRDEVRSVRGSTRLEAKRQRRRDGREAGRRRAPILSEAEFLARREAVDRAMVIRERADRIQIGVLEDGVLVEHFVTSSGTGSLVGNVYLGRVQNVLPSMEAAFVDIGRGRNAVLYAGEVDWDAAGLEGKARKIEQALQTGDSVLVQVTKDPVGHKGARLTTQISLPGRFLVYVPGGGATGISRKLPENERRRLKDVLKRVVPEDAGVIIRTASEGISEEELARDVRRLQAQWQVIKDKTEGTNGARKVSAPSLVYEEPDLLVKVVRDLFTEDFSALVVQGDTAWETVDAYVRHVAPELADRLRKHVGNTDVFAEYRIDEQLLKALDRKVWLPSGGYLVIDRTEAMTVIDVNTGKFTGSGGNLEETVTRNNLESAEEIVRQLRLRDIGGIIVIDFIDMVLESNRDLVLRRLTECLGRDRTRHQVAEVTSLGLVQMTRKRVGTGLLEAFGTTCEHCKGRGVLVTTDPVSKPNGTNGHTEPARGNTRRSRGRTEDNKDQKDKPVSKDAAKEAAAQAAKDAVRGIAKATSKGTDTQPRSTADTLGTGGPAETASRPADTAPGGTDSGSRTADSVSGVTNDSRTADVALRGTDAGSRPAITGSDPAARATTTDAPATTATEPPTTRDEPTREHSRHRTRDRSRRGASRNGASATAHDAGDHLSTSGEERAEFPRQAEHTNGSADRPAEPTPAPADASSVTEQSTASSSTPTEQATSTPRTGSDRLTEPAGGTTRWSAPSPSTASSGTGPETATSEPSDAVTAPGVSAPTSPETPAPAAAAPTESAAEAVTPQTPAADQPGPTGPSAEEQSATDPSTEGPSAGSLAGPSVGSSAGSSSGGRSVGGQSTGGLSAGSAGLPARSSSGGLADEGRSTEGPSADSSAGQSAEKPSSAKSSAEGPSTEGASAEASSVPAPATPPRRQPRRAASRPAGPPVSARHDG